MRATKEHYNGDIQNGVKHGHGTYVYEGSYFQYEGEWQKNKKHGRGVLTLGDGTRYEGSFSAGEMCGEGTKLWPDGATYTGTFEEGEPHGRGTFQSPTTGEQYCGEWCAGARSGEGTLQLPQQGLSYSGSFLKHRFSGQGTLTDCTSQVRWQGNFDAGCFTGDEANIILPNGVSYHGPVHSGKRQGNGTMTYEEGNTRLAFNASFVDDEAETVEVEDVLSIKRVEAMTGGALPLSAQGTKLALSKSHEAVLLTLAPMQCSRKIKIEVHHVEKSRSSVAASAAASLRKGSARLGRKACDSVYANTSSEGDSGPVSLPLNDLAVGTYILALSDVTAFPKFEVPTAEKKEEGEGEEEVTKASGGVTQVKQDSPVPFPQGLGPVHRDQVARASFAAYQPQTAAPTRMILELKA